MRKALWLLVSILTLAVMVAPSAKADSAPYSIDFTVTGGTVATPPTGSFDYDPVAGTFTPFTVTWDGTLFSFTGTSGSAPIPPALNTWYADSSAGYLVFATSVDPFVVLVGTGTPASGPDETAAGTLTSGPITATPEPPTYGLILAGLGLVAAMRKRTPRALVQA
jgi:hypothetical protein